MEGNKTGALLACAVSIGAVLGGADDRTADTLEAYGYHLGLAFQAVDDLLGIWGDPESTGKQTWSDLRQRKKSLPVVAALAEGGRPRSASASCSPRTPRAPTSTASPRRSSPPGRRSSRRRAAASGPPRRPVGSMRSPSRRCTVSTCRKPCVRSSRRSRTSSSYERDDHHSHMTRSRRSAPSKGADRRRPQHSRGPTARRGSHDSDDRRKHRGR